MKLVLASTSRFRRELLSRLGLPFETAAPVCDETPLPNESALETAVRLARIKAESLKAQFPDALLIGSDQVALLDGEQIGKPGTLDKARAMLQSMSGRTVSFHTALAVYNAKTAQLREAVDITHVTLRALGPDEIDNYLAREPDALHCAGAAKSEGLGGALIERIVSSDPNALIGLPLFALVTLLKNEGVKIL
jgi:septum formation protein